MSNILGTKTNSINKDASSNSVLTVRYLYIVVEVDAVGMHNIQPIGGCVTALTVAVVVNLLSELAQLIVARHAFVKLTVVSTSNHGAIAMGILVI